VLARAQTWTPSWPRWIHSTTLYHICLGPCISPFRYHDQNLRKLYCVPELLFHSCWIHFYISLTKKSLKLKLFVAMCRQWNIAIFLKIWMWWFPVQDWSLWVPVAHSFGSPLAEAWFWPPNLSSLRVTGCIYAPLRTIMACRVKNLFASVTFSTSDSNILITAHFTCTILLYFNMGCLFWPIQFGRYSEYLSQVHELTGLLTLGSTPPILLTISFLPKLNLNFIHKEIKLQISCISSGL